MDLLAGIRVLDWTTAQQGPVAASLLGSWGADVIKIEARETGELGRGVVKMHGGIDVTLPHGLNAYFEVNNLNKRGLAVDLKKPQGKEIVYRLASKSDIFIHNFRPRVADRLGMDYRTLARHNSRLIYAVASGFGAAGPEANNPVYDYAAQARSGLMQSSGEPGMPPVFCSLGLSDQTGALCLTAGILAALFARERLGMGQEVKVSLLDSAMFLQGLSIGCMLLKHIEHFPRFSRLEPKNALWNHYECADGRWISLALPGTDADWEKFCRVMCLAELYRDPRFRDIEGRTEHGTELAQELRNTFNKRPVAEWCDILVKGDVISAAVQKITELPDDPQVIANEYVHDFDHPVLGKVKVLSNPLQLTQTPAKTRLPAPALGQHTEDILLEIGYSWDEISRLKAEEVI